MPVFRQWSDIVFKFFSKASRSTTMHGVGRSSLYRFLKSRRTIRASTSGLRFTAAANEFDVAARTPPPAAAPKKRLREVMGKPSSVLLMQEWYQSGFLESNVGRFPD